MAEKHDGVGHPPTPIFVRDCKKGKQKKRKEKRNWQKQKIY